MKQEDILRYQLGLPVIESGEDLAWRDHAACAHHDPEMFHPEGKYPKNSPEYRAFVAKAVAICERCKVQEPCLFFGMTQPQGIWGGTTSSQRASIRRASRPRVINVITEPRKK